MKQHWPIDHLFDPNDPANIIANASFEMLDDDGNLAVWDLLEGEAVRTPRCADHACLLSGRLRSNRFEMPAHVPFEITGEVCGTVSVLVHIIEHDRYLRAERFEHTSEDWAAFRFFFLPPPNAERAEIELRGDGVVIDELRLDGLGARDYTILDTQSGYHPYGTKRVLVQSRDDIDGTVAWELIDTLRGMTLAKGVLEAIGKDLWGRWSWVADFTDCQREGNYLLRVHLPKRILESAPIRINNDVYRDLARIVAKYSYLQRCGMDIPGYHKACHTNDALIRNTTQGDDYGEVIEYRDLTGSWHDAGDYNKWFHYFGYVLETLALMHVRLPESAQRHTYGGDVPDILSEVFWGADFFLKAQNHDGSFLPAICGWYPEDDASTGGKKNSPWAIFWEPPHEDSGSPEIMHPRSRGITYEDALPSPTLVLDYATSLAMSALAAAGTDDVRAMTYSNAALRSVEWILAEESDLAEHPYFVTLWDALYRVTGQTQYRDKASALVPIILGKQLDDGSFGPTGGLKHPFHQICALMELVIDEPDHPVRERITNAAVRYTEWLESYLMQDAPYGLLLQPIADEDPGVLNVRTFGRNAYIGNAAYVYALTGRLTGDRSLLARAEDQLAWLLGVNPHGVCQVVDAGRVHAGRYHGYSNHNENDLCGAITGGIINGIALTDSGHTTWTTMPPLFPILSVRRTDVPYAEHIFQNARHDSNEYWSLHHAGFQQAVAALAGAYEDVAKPPKALLLYSNETGYDQATAYDELFADSGFEIDRIAADTRYPHFDPRAYRIIVVSESWNGAEYIEGDAMGVTARHSFTLGVPWVFIRPSDAALEWVDSIASGPTAYEPLPPPSDDWTACDTGRVRHIAASELYQVADLDTLKDLIVARCEDA
jgi:hypothetical protein